MDILAANRLFYSGSACVAIIVWALSKTYAKKSKPLTIVLVYIFMAMLFAFGIMIGTIGNPDEVAASYIALLLTTPLLFTDRPIRMIGLIAVTSVTFILVCMSQKAPHTWETDITNGIVFGCVGAIIAIHFCQIKAARFALLHTVQHMAETDQLTELRNRTSYEQRLQTLNVLRSGSLYCIYVDVNGLHELNDTKGHAAGDRMLQYIAAVMQNTFGVENTYRIGGDEYVALGENQSREVLEKKIVRFRQAVEAAGYHVAIGMNLCSRSPVDVTEMVQSAEQEMYRDKAEYYQKNGLDRRRR